MSNNYAKHSIFLADGVVVPDSLTSNCLVELQDRMVSGHRRLAIIIYGDAIIDFVQGGQVIVDFPSNNRRLAVFANKDVLYIEYFNPVKLRNVKLNHRFCVKCAANTGETRMYMPRPSSPGPLYQCIECSEVWGQDLPNLVLDQV